MRRNGRNSGLEIRRGGLAAGLVAVLLAACVTLPDTRQIEQRVARWEKLYENNCRALPSDAELRAAVGGGDGFEFVQRMSRIEATLARRPLVPGNSVTLLKDGPATHQAQLAAIALARHHIHLDVYIFDDDEMGKRYVEALTERARAGVQVRVILDSFGEKGAEPVISGQLKQGGVEVRVFNTVNPLDDLRIWRVTRRSHRKTLVVDGKLAFTGGININDDYSGSSRASASSSASIGWRDTHVRIDGPAVAEFQRSFLEYWAMLGDAAPEQPAFYPPLKPVGSELVRLITDQGQDLLDQLLLMPADAAGDAMRGRHSPRHANIYATYLMAIRESRKRVWITQAYFAPNDELVDALKEAAGRGVDVRLLMPGRTDVGLLIDAAHFYYQPLLDAGIRLFEEKDTVMHAKTAVIDSVWATVGSANLDYRSFINNDEANAIIVGRAFAAQMEQMYEQDLAAANEIDAAAWPKRSLRQRLRERFAATVKFLL
jgi:cardiolipin synthase